MTDGIIKLKKGWLSRQLREAHKDYNSLPKWLRKLMESERL